MPAPLIQIALAALAGGLGSGGASSIVDGLKGLGKTVESDAGLQAALGYGEDQARAYLRGWRDAVSAMHGTAAAQSAVPVESEAVQPVAAVADALNRGAS